MPSLTVPRDITVGYDGSEQSRAAVTWAADEARLTGSRLTLVTVVRRGAEGLDPRATSAQVLRELGHRTSDPEVAQIRETHPGVDVRAVVHIGSPRVELERAARDCGLMVLGLRRRSQVTRVLTGSVTEHLLRASATDLVLIPPIDETPGAGVAGSGRILALVGPHSTGRALDAAVEEGARRGGVVSVVRATRTPSGAVTPESGRAVRTVYARTDDGRPGARLPLHLYSGTAAEFLREEPLQPADLVVLGRHEHAHGAHLLVDATITTLLCHPKCAVLVVDDTAVRETVGDRVTAAGRRHAGAPVAVSQPATT